MLSGEIVEANEKMDQSVFEGFIGKEVKAPYRDGSQFKIARGVLDSISNGFIRISGKLGTIIINEKNIEKMSRVSVRGASRENGESRAS